MILVCKIWIDMSYICIKVLNMIHPLDSIQKQYNNTRNKLVKLDLISNQTPEI